MKLGGLFIKGGCEPIGGLSSIGPAKDNRLLEQQDTGFYPTDRLQPLSARPFDIDFQRCFPRAARVAFDVGSRLDFFAYGNELVAMQMVDPSETHRAVLA